MNQAEARLPAAAPSELLPAVDAVAPGTVLVLAPGRLGGQGFTLVVVDVAARAELEAQVAAWGYRQKGLCWAHFADFTARYLEVCSAPDLGLPPGEFSRLEARSSTLAGLSRCRAASVPDLLLLQAVAFGADPRVPPECDRDRMAVLLRGDPSAWVAAAARADAWGVPLALRALRRACDAGRSPGERERRAIVQERGRAGRDQPEVVRRSVLVAFSGLDGSGKSTQAYALATAMRAMGRSTAVEWSRVTHLRWMPALYGLVRRVAAAAPGHDASASAPDDATDQPPDPDSRALRLRHPRVSATWAALLAVGSALSYRPADRDPPADVVVRDRYVLDTLVHLRTTYGGSHPTRVQERLHAALSPPPTCAVLLEVPPQVAYRRRRELPLPVLEAQAAAYAECAARLGVVVLDARRRPEDLASEIAALVWDRLPT